MVSLTKLQILDSIALALTTFKQSSLTWVAQFKYPSKCAPKYFTWWNGYTFLPHIFNLRSVSKTLPISSKDNYFSFGNIKRDFASIEPM